MPVTATISDQNPAEDAINVETANVVSTHFQPTDVGNAITTITATFDGAAATVTVTNLIAGEKLAEFDADFVLEATHEVEWTVTTADANANVFTYTFEIREADWSVEAASVYAADLGWSDEAVSLVAVDRTAYTNELAHLVSAERDTTTDEAVSLSVIEGLGSGYYSDELVDLIVAILEEIDVAIPLSISVAPGDNSRLALSIDVESEREHNRLPLAINVFSQLHTPALPLALQVSEGGESRLALSIQVAPGEESRLPLALEIEGAAAQPVPFELRLTNEALDAEES